MACTDYLLFVGEKLHLGVQKQFPIQDDRRGRISNPGMHPGLFRFQASARQRESRGDIAHPPDVRMSSCGLEWYGKNRLDLLQEFGASRFMFHDVRSRDILQEVVSNLHKKSDLLLKR
jgi:hypothetical protein